MSTRTVVIRHVTDRMVAAFTKGDFIDAQNMNAFLVSLEQMTDDEYTELSDAEISGAIS